jgi:hypothetical protein
MVGVGKDLQLVLQVADDTGGALPPLLRWLGVLEEVLEEPPDHSYGELCWRSYVFVAVVGSFKKNLGHLCGSHSLLHSQQSGLGLIRLDGLGKLGGQSLHVDPLRVQLFKHPKELSFQPLLESQFFGG